MGATDGHALKERAPKYCETSIVSIPCSPGIFLTIPDSGLDQKYRPLPNTGFCSQSRQEGNGKDRNDLRDMGSDFPNIQDGFDSQCPYQFSPQAKTVAP